MAFAHFRIGLNYEPPRGWADFDAQGLARDFAFIADLGIDLVRAAIPWEFLCPTPDRASQVGMGKLLSTLDAAAARNLQVIPAVLEGTPGYLAGRSPWDDAAVIRIQVRQLRQIGERFGGHQAIAAWDLGAVPDRHWAGLSADAAWLWAHVVCGEFRRAVPQPLMVTFAREAAPWPHIRDHIDFAGVAVDPAGATVGRWPHDPLVPAFSAVVASTLSGRPAFATDLDPQGPEEPSATYYREALEALWRAGAAGAFASHARLRRQPDTRSHAADLAHFARDCRPLQPVPDGVRVDPEQFQADPTGALRALFHEFAV